jgi:ribosomal protein L32
VEIKNCPECGKVFSTISGDICPECKKIEEEEYEKVYKFLKENPLSSIERVVSETGVSRRKILKFLKRGEITGMEIQKELRCSHCGRPISVGRFCKDCAKKLSDKLKGKEMLKKEEKSQKEKSDFHTINEIRKKLKGE